MKKRLYLAVMRPGMKNYAQQALPVEATEEEFLARPEVKQVIANAKLFGDKVRLMADNPNPTAANWFVRELV